jgi:diadenosine tetraphosphate (Ap4A) HIT family hydrolase
MGDSPQAFTLDPVLSGDCFVLGDFPLCRLLLMNDANYPWFILVPRRAGLREIYELDAGDQRQLMAESCRLSASLAACFNADKMNVAALGNVVAQLHVHHVVRYRDDRAWPAPVWGRLPAVPYEESEVVEVASRLRGALGDDFEMTHG